MGLEIAFGFGSGSDFGFSMDVAIGVGLGLGFGSGLSGIFGCIAGSDMAPRVDWVRFGVGFLHRLG